MINDQLMLIVGGLILLLVAVLIFRSIGKSKVETEAADDHAEISTAPVATPQPVESSQLEVAAPVEPAIPVAPVVEPAVLAAEPVVTAPEASVESTSQVVEPVAEKISANTTDEEVVPPAEVTSSGLISMPIEPGSPFLTAPSGDADDLSRIKGIGPKLSTRLRELGVFHYSQIAAWTPEQAAYVDSLLGNFQGRLQRDRWQEQAALLAAGDVKAYEKAHGKLGPAAGSSSVA